MRRALIFFIMMLGLLALIAAPANAFQGSDIVRFGSDVVVSEGETETGSVVVFGGDAVINGGVEDDVVVFGGDIRLGDSAVIEGDLVHFGGRVVRSPGAVVMGDEITGFGGRFLSPLSLLVWSLVTLIGTLALALVIVAILPEQTRVLADTIEREPLQSLGVGFLATILIPFIFLALLILIIIGWILIPFVAIAIPILYFYGFVGVSRWLGRRVIGSTHFTTDTPVAEVVTGVLILGAVGFLPVLGWIVEAIAALFGLGAVILSKFGTGKPWFGGRPAPKAPPAPRAKGGARGSA